MASGAAPGTKPPAMPNESRNQERLEAALRSPTEFPRNVFAQDVQEHSLKTLETLLNARSNDLFCEASKAQILVFELYKDAEGYHKKALKDFDSFDACLTAPLRSCRPDPRRRFIFINAPSSRAPLKTTRQMFLQLLTYHCVMPAFLHYVFPFGNQHYVRDFHVMGYRSNSCLDSPRQSMVMPKLLRSGRHVEICYSLKSVEHTPEQSQAWSIRQCSLYHRFDLEHEQMIWIVIKGNRVIQDAIQQQCQSARSSQSTDHDAFPATLATHLILATWCGENWHWYINDLESTVRLKTSRGLYIPYESTAPESSPKKTPTLDAQSDPQPRRRSTGILRSLSKVFNQSDGVVESQSNSSTLQNAGATLVEEPTSIDDISFQDLQEVHHFEVKANEALLILKANCNVIWDLRNEYRNSLQHGSFPVSLRDKYHANVARFDQQLSTVQQDLAMQQDKVEILLRMIADRKNFLQGILQFRNMQATKLLAEKAQESAESMELYTKAMHIIAMKTKVETVSMRIITLVTLFFLPGTFISTLMSTPMVHFDSTKPGFSLENIGVGALQLYLLVSLPLVLLTFLAWFAVHRWEKRRGQRAKDKTARAKKGEV